MASNKTRILNLALHVTTLATRFLFVFFLAKFLEPAQVGYYGIFTASVGYALYFVGLDFYTYVSREMIRVPANQRGRLLKSQASLSGFLYLVFLPFGIFFLAQSGWPGHLVWWFFPILILEHFNQEMSRLLVALSEQLTASVIMFVRQGSWALAIVAWMFADLNARNLDQVMLFWAIAGVAAAITSIWKIIQLKTSGWTIPIDWAWVKRGIVVSAAFLLATLALRGVQTFDRYWLEALGGIQMVGAYVLLLGVAGTLLTFLDAAVFSFAYPALIKHNHIKEYQEAHKKIKKIFLQTLVFSISFGLLSWLLLPFLLTWIGNPIYLEALSWYPLLLTATILNALSMVLHYGLYAQGGDKPIIYSHIASLIAFIIVTWVCSGIYRAGAVPIGLNAAFAVILFWKSFAYWLLIRKVGAPKPPTSQA